MLVSLEDLNLWSRNASMKEDLPNDAFPATRTFKLTGFCSCYSLIASKALISEEINCEERWLKDEIFSG